MPKAATHTLTWSPEQHTYLLHDPDNGAPLPIQESAAAWLAWLATHTSFSFQGKKGRLNLLKEARKDKGAGYWYAYQRQGRRTLKKYVGRGTDLTPERLEERVQILMAPASKADETSPGPPETLLAPKLRPPRLHTPLVERSRLLALLDAGLERRLTLISAPAGSGKTTLVRQWLEYRDRNQRFLPVAWVSLDAGDNDALRFWRYIITACQTFLVDQGESALALLSAASQPPFKAPDLEATLTTLLNALTHSERSGVLVLEDYHTITSPQIATTMAFFLDHLPATLHLLIIGRGNPPLALTRLRASGDLTEIYAAELRFSQAEMVTFFQQNLTLPLSTFSEATLQHLETLLEGWAAGLRLFSLTLQGHSSQNEIERSLVMLAGSQRPILDYFVTEVLDAQPEPLQRFLLQTSPLTRLSGPLCDTLTGRQDSEALLDALARANLFLERLDEPERWYHYHALFAEAMQHEARQRLGETALRTLSLRASQWYARQGLLSEAIEASLKAEDWSRATAIIEQLINTQRFNIIYEFTTLCQWLELLPSSIVHHHPLLCLNYARALSYRSIPDYPTPTTLTKIDELLSLAEQGWRAKDNPTRLGEVLSFRSLVAFRLGDREQSGNAARQALTLLPPEEQVWRGTSLQFVGVEELLSGQFNTARTILMQARAIWEATGNIHGKRSNTLGLALVCFAQGELRLAAEYYRQVLTQAREVGDRTDIAPARSGLAQIFYEWNALDTAWEAAQEVYEIGEQLSEEGLKAQGALMQIQILYARGHIPQAQQQLAALIAQLPVTSPQQTLHLDVFICQTRLQLASGDLAAAQRSLMTLAQHSEGLSQLSLDQIELLRARLLLAQAQTEAALSLLERLLPTTRKGGNTRMDLEIQLLRILAHHSQAVSREQIQETLHQMQTLLALARTEGYLRLFADEGDVMCALLHNLLPHLREKSLITYVQTILSCIGTQQTVQGTANTSTASNYFEPLSPHEQRVLRLLVAERTYEEIARELIVSTNTIKTQVSSIYRKLNVHSRRAAREAAHHWNLL